MTFLSDLGVLCGAVGVTMSAAGSVLLDVVDPFGYKVFLAVQTGIIALGTFATAQSLKTFVNGVSNGKSGSKKA